MNVRVAAALLLGCASVARGADVAPAAGPEAPAAWHRWELDGFAGYGRLAWPGLDSSTTRWSNGGAAFALTVAYRSPHFTHPFLDVAWVPFLASGQDVVDPATGLGVYSTSSTHALAVSVGPGFDLSWFRVRAGVGGYWVTTTITTDGVTNSSTAVKLGYLLSASALFWESGPFAAGVEARFVALHAPGQGIYQTSWSAGLTGRWDFVRR